MSLQKEIDDKRKEIRTDSYSMSIILGIDFSVYSTKSKLIDEKLLKSRNEIAHGNYLLIDRDGYIELHEIVIEMINTFRNQIENAAINENFKRNNS
ncbi:hypothetical protein cce_4371 [Crocosphaera subtropica ATCC 51142]|uniref:MAE-28990/MAE-18760-like HEPN domain-containing protein n=1 Tax=Crocosphaera subtropica (strain ATCC 51142 / BH68) TaxID=43989 RepID=B1WTK4_CROS5|nr:MAE_28990/MAE_18760 family HEPN-like nuclease [Crocosphaera subtropica]ACB53719.1 hypothetical protein cce_4371 [Crocosphaera subtropica ATCC 51142]